MSNRSDDPADAMPPVVMNDAAGMPARAVTDVFEALDTALEMSPVKSARVRRLHGAYTRAVFGLLRSAQELELHDDCQGEAAALRRIATDTAIHGMWSVRAAGRLT